MADPLRKKPRAGGAARGNLRAWGLGGKKQARKTRDTPGNEIIP